MSEENEEVQKELKIKNSKDDSEIKISGSVEDVDKLKTLLKEQNVSAKRLNEENARLMKERSEAFEKQFGESGNSAPLNDNQLTGGLSEGEKQLFKECLPSDNSGLPADMMTFRDDFDMINQLEKMAQSGDKETKAEAKQALAKLLQKATEKSFDFEFNGDPRDLYRKPKDEKERIELSKKRQQWERIR